MKVFRVILHSFILSMVNIISILFGFGVYHFFRDYNQLSIQVPVGAVFSIIVFTSWVVILKYKGVSWLLLESRLEPLLILLLSLAWLPVIFIPLHYLTQGYLTTFGNIYVHWIFQIPVNLIIVIIFYFIMFTGSTRNKETNSV
ncbi:MAG: hypothetical protein AVO38_00540 [delta proteobacterium ML8_D]|jgi:hypothetical protein|nr:MAG: hypothetical protein AVO38_00540 [delta proteobacterium ML8_D]